MPYIFFALALPSLSIALEKAPKGPKPKLFEKGSAIEITADTISYDKERSTYFAEGSVFVVQDNAVLKADSAVFDVASGTATAVGHVSAVDSAGDTLTGEIIQMDINDKTMVMPRARLFYKLQNIHLAGDPILKTGPRSYSAKHLTYTTCDCKEGESPAWHFSATSADIEFGEYLTGWNGLFHIKGAPVLYFPYFVVPVKRERQTGFLQPRPGYSRLRGFVYDQPFFWAISRNTDATFTLDLESARGIGEAVEYRYIRTRRSSGEIFFQHFRENDIDRVRQFRQSSGNLARPESAGNERMRLALIHNELLPGNVNFRANINLVSDDEFFLDFGKGNERTKESIESNVSLSKSWRNWSLVGQMRHFNNLLQKGDATTLQKLPELSLTGFDQAIPGTPFYFSSQTSFINFARHEGVSGQRLDVQPRLSLPLSPGRYFDFTPSITPRGTFYLVKDDPEGRFFERYLYTVSADLATTFVRVYRPEIEWLEGLKHTIRPHLIYTYIPERDQSRLPSFDAVDNILPQNTITYALTTILTGKIIEDGVKKRYHDYVFLEVTQSYDIKEATRETSGGTDRRKPFLPVTAELVVRPDLLTTLRAKASYDVYTRKTSSHEYSAVAADRRGDSLGVTWRGVIGTANYFEANARARLFAPVDLTYLRRYSVTDHKSLEDTYGIEYKHQCWGAVLTYSQRLEEKIVFVTFNLLGLGRVGGLQGGL